MTWLNVLVHLFVMAYAVRAVCLRLRACDSGRDRRRPDPNHVAALQAGFILNAAVLCLALLAEFTDGGRRLAYVRVMWEMSNLLCVAVAWLAFRALQHCRRSARVRKTTEMTA